MAWACLQVAGRPDIVVPLATEAAVAAAATNTVTVKEGVGRGWLPVGNDAVKCSCLCTMLLQVTYVTKIVFTVHHDVSAGVLPHST